MRVYPTPLLVNCGKCTTDRHGPEQDESSGRLLALATIPRRVPNVRGLASNTTRTSCRLCRPCSPAGATAQWLRPQLPLLYTGGAACRVRAPGGALPARRRRGGGVPAQLRPRLLLTSCCSTAGRYAEDVTVGDLQALFHLVSGWGALPGRPAPARRSQGLEPCT